MIDLTENETGRLQKIIEDKNIVSGLKKVFLNAFLSKESRSVHELAAAKLAIELLEEGFRELNKLKNMNTDEKKQENIV